MKKLIKTFEVKDVEKYLPDLDLIFALANLQLQQPPQPQQGVLPGMGGAQGGGYGGQFGSS